MNCTSGTATVADGGTWATFCKARETASVIVLERVAKISWERASCVGAGTAWVGSCNPDRTS